MRDICLNSGRCTRVRSIAFKGEHLTYKRRGGKRGNEHMKRCWGIFMCVLLFCLPVGAQAAPCLSIGSYTASHETVEIAVSLKGNTGFVSYQMDVVYDADFLQPIELKGGLGGTPTYNLQGSSAGESCVKVAYASMGPVEGDGILFTLRFQVKEALEPGQSTLLQLKAVRLFSEDGTDIKTTVEDGTVAAPPASGSSSPADESATASSGPSVLPPSGTAPGSRPAAQTGSADGTDTASQTSGPASSPAATAPAGTPSAPATQSTTSDSSASAGEPGQTAAPDRPTSSVSAQAPPAQTSSLPVVIFGCILGGVVVAIGAVLAVLYRKNKSRNSPDESSNGQ